MKPKSEVWKHFTKFTDEDGILKCKCNYCSKTYHCASKKYGTSTLKAHVTTCICNPKNVDAQQPHLSLKPREGEFKKQTQMKPKSEVWEHFTKFTNEGGELKCRCNNCSKTYPCASKKYGTSTLKAHMTACICDPKTVDAQPLHLTFKPSQVEATSSVSCWEFDQDASIEKLVKMIVKDELPFIHIEGEGFVDFIESLQPKFTIPSIWTIPREILKLYKAEKEKLQTYFITSGVTVCITTDIWTSEQNINFLCVTAHYIDDSWMLKKKVINFCAIDSQKGEEIGRQIDGCLRDWGIARVLAITVDNSSANDSCVTFLEGRLTSRGCDVVKGEHLHIRCSTQIVNLIVCDGLEVINQSIKRVRDVVRYVKHFSSRLARFKECCADEGIESKSSLCLDVSTMWNSTYLMLSVALEFEKAFQRYESKDPSFKADLVDGVPTPTDWEVVKTVVDVLGVFYDLTLRVSSHVLVTSHQVFHVIDTVGNMLRDLVDSSTPGIKEMTLKMKDKYDEYWGEPRKINKLVYLAVVLDPRHKFRFMEYFFVEEYGVEEGAKLVFDLRSVLDNLYEHYQSLHQPISQSANAAQDPEDVAPPMKKAKTKYSRSDRYNREFDAYGDGELKNDLDIYLSEKPLRNEKEDFDILKWWDTQQCRLPILSNLARDILALPTSSVPLESAFNTGGRVLDAFRSSLDTHVVEALLCTQDWLKKPKQMPTIEDELASLKRLEEGLEFIF